MLSFIAGLLAATLVSERAFLLQLKRDQPNTDIQVSRQDKDAC